MHDNYYFPIFYFPTRVGLTLLPWRKLRKYWTVLLCSIYDASRYTQSHRVLRKKSIKSIILIISRRTSILLINYLLRVWEIDFLRPIDLRVKSLNDALRLILFTVRRSCSVFMTLWKWIFNKHCLCQSIDSRYLNQG